jgi:hypothetical protein
MRWRSRRRSYRYGAGVFKLDWALDGPIPWTAAEAARAGTVHLGGTLDEIAAARTRSRAAGIPSSPSCCSCSRAPSTPRAPSRKAHRLGLLPRAQRVDGGHDGRDRGTGGAFRARLLRPGPGPAPRWTRSRSSGATPTTWAGTSSAAGRTCASSSLDRSRARCPTHPRSRASSSALLHAPRRRRARHVRLLGGPGGAPD